MTRRQIVSWLIGAALLLGAGALAWMAAMRTLDLPPSDAHSLAGILHSVERKDVGAIKSVEYERDWWQLTGAWEVTACKQSCFKLYIDPKTGEERRRKSDEAEDELPPARTQGATAIARSFEQGKFGFITEMEFEHGAWQVKFREARGLTGALQPTRRRVFEPGQPAMMKERLVPRAAPFGEPRKPAPYAGRPIRVSTAN